MIGIFCSAEDNYAKSIIDYLNFYGCKYQIIHLNEFDDLICEIDTEESEIGITLIDKNNLRICLNEFSFFLLRSGEFNFKEIEINNISFDKKVAKTYFEIEKNTLIDFIYSFLSKNAIGYFNRMPLNKLEQLSVAKAVGLMIPKTFIASNKFRIVEKFENHSIFTKAIQENISYQDESQICYQRVTKLLVNDLPEKFFPSLFQEEVSKELEIRTFYLDNVFYSIGYCNQSSTVDSRDNYNEMIYFKIELPNGIESKLKKLMQRLNLISGSIDLIYSKNGEFLFLEVNTQGQYDWVSKLGGYNLDKVIAQFLMKKENEKL